VLLQYHDFIALLTEKKAAQKASEPGTDYNAGRQLRRMKYEGRGTKDERQKILRGRHWMGMF
jgi:hypothetical protein